MLRAGSAVLAAVAVPRALAAGAIGQSRLGSILRCESSLAQEPKATVPLFMHDHMPLLQATEPAGSGVNGQQMLAGTALARRHEERRLDRVGKAVNFLHSELHLPECEVQRLLPSVVRAPLFVQNRLRLLRSLGLSNTDVAHLIQSTPNVLALPPAASVPVLEERMQLLGLHPANLHSFLMQCPNAAPLLLRSRLSASGIKKLRCLVSQLAERKVQVIQ